MSRLESIITNPDRTELEIMVGLGQIWLNGRPKNPIPTYQSLILALRFQLEAIKAPAYGYGKMNDAPYQVFDQTGLRMFEFFDAVSYAIEREHLKEELVRNQTRFWEDLKMFEKYRNSVLQYHPSPRYQEHISFIESFC